LVEHLASGERPGEEVASSIESSEEAILLSPYHILVFLAHADAVNEIDVRVGNHSDFEEALEEAESVAEFTVVQ